MMGSSSGRDEIVLNDWAYYGIGTSWKNEGAAKKVRDNKKFYSLLAAAAADLRKRHNQS